MESTYKHYHYYNGPGPIAVYSDILFAKVGNCWSQPYLKTSLLLFEISFLVALMCTNTCTFLKIYSHSVVLIRKEYCHTPTLPQKRYSSSKTLQRRARQIQLCQIYLQRIKNIITKKRKRQATRRQNQVRYCCRGPLL